MSDLGTTGWCVRTTDDGPAAIGRGVDGYGSRIAPVPSAVENFIVWLRRFPKQAFRLNFASRRWINTQG